MDFETKLRIWILDDLEHRRHAHEKIVQQELPGVEIIKVPHALKLRKIIQNFDESLTAKVNLFFSDYNMFWRNCEWLNANPYEACDLEYEPGYDNYPGTVKVLTECRGLVGDFLLVMLSSMVVEVDQALYSGGYRETIDEAWTYEEMLLNSLELEQVHKLTKPFNVQRLKQALKHLQFALDKNKNYG